MLIPAQHWRTCPARINPIYWRIILSLVTIHSIHLRTATILLNGPLLDPGNPYLAPPPIPQPQAASQPPPGTLGDPLRHMDGGKFESTGIACGRLVQLAQCLFHLFQFPKGPVKIQWSRLIHFKTRDLLTIYKMLIWPLHNTSTLLIILIRTISHRLLQARLRPMQLSPHIIQLHRLPALFHRLNHSRSLKLSPIIRWILSSNTHTFSPIPFQRNSSQHRYSRPPNTMLRQRWRLPFNSNNPHRLLCLRRLWPQRKRIYLDLPSQQRTVLTLILYDQAIRIISPISFRHHHRTSTLSRHKLHFYHLSQFKQQIQIIIIIMVSTKQRQRLSMRCGHTRRQTRRWISLTRLHKQPWRTPQQRWRCWITKAEKTPRLPMRFSKDWIRRRNRTSKQNPYDPVLSLTNVTFSLTDFQFQLLRETSADEKQATAQVFQLYSKRIVSRMISGNS